MTLKLWITRIPAADDAKALEVTDPLLPPPWGRAVCGAKGRPTMEPPLFAPDVTFIQLVVGVVQGA